MDPLEKSATIPALYCPGVMHRKGPVYQQTLTCFPARRVSVDALPRPAAGPVNCALSVLSVAYITSSFLCDNLFGPSVAVLSRFILRQLGCRSLGSMSKRPCPAWQSAPSIKRAKQIDEESPYKTLEELLRSKTQPDTTRNVLHWFRSKDLRLLDNRALHAASKKAEEGDGALITLYVHSPEDLEWHGTSPARTDLILETLSLMQAELQTDNIPLYIHETAARNKLVPDVLKFIRDNDVSHVYGNFEYEIDELNRDLRLGRALKDEKISFEVLHDQCAVNPGSLKTGSGGPHKVFTPYHKVWLLEMSKKGKTILDLLPKPSGNSGEKKKKCDDLDLFKTEVPKLPDSKSFKSDEERQRIRKLWPAGHKAAKERLVEFLDGKVKEYANTRSDPAADSTSRMSAYFSTGTISVRETLAYCRDRNKGSSDFSETKGRGMSAWVREIVFREYYRQLIAVMPHNSLNLPQNLKMASVAWRADEEAEENWEKWCQGMTGFPLVDAGMRQLNHEAWMHNRARMNTASLLRTNMLIDYRRGERYFAEHLVDWDMSNNTQGWEPSVRLICR